MKDISGGHILQVNANVWNNLMVWSLYLNKFALSWFNYVTHNREVKFLLKGEIKDDLRSIETGTGGSHESIESALLIPYRCASAFL